MPLISIFTAFVAILPNLSHTLVQALTPPILQEYASARVGSNFYIQSGFSRTNGTITLNSTTLYTLDLSTSWSTSSPPWKSLGTGPKLQAETGAVYGNNQTFISISFTQNPSVYTFTPYSVKTSTWGTALTVTNTSTASDILQYGAMPVVDPTTGLLYIPGNTNMNTLDLNTFIWKPAIVIPAGILTSRYWGSAVYNPARRTFMYTSGVDYNVPIVNFDPIFIVTEYTISTGGWSTLSTSSLGSPPSMANHCSAVSEDGSTLVIFGGRLSVTLPSTYSGAIYLLDISTGTWTAGPSYKTNLITAGCVIVGSQFMAWGGALTITESSTNVEPLIFDMTAKVWITSYTAPAYYQSATTNSSSTMNSPNTKSSGLGTIIGVVAGVMVIVVGIGFEVFRRQRVRQKKVEHQEHERLSKQKLISLEAEMSNSGGGDGGGGAGESGSSDNNSSLGYYIQKPLDHYSPYFAPNVGHIPISVSQPSFSESKTTFEMDRFISKSEVSLNFPPPTWSPAGSSPGSINRGLQSSPQLEYNGYYGMISTNEQGYQPLVDMSPRVNYSHKVVQKRARSPQYHGPS